MILVDRLGLGEGDAGIGSDDPGDLADAYGNGGVVVVLAEGRHHGTADVAHFGVVEDAFQTVAHLDAVLAGGYGDDQEDAAICALGAYLPLVFEGCGELVDGLVVVEGLDGDDGD